MNFTAIDFETATSVYSSICSLGICVVEDNKIVEKKSFLIKPDPFVFNDYNILIHGIHPEDVIDAGTFDEHWDEIKPYLEGKTIIAHNAQFDVGALRAVLDHYSIEYPEFEYLCTVKLSQKAYPELESHKLNCLGEALNICFNHHDACEDAFACAQIMLCMIRDFNIETIQDIEDRFEVQIGKIYPGYYEPCKKKRKRKKTVTIKSKQNLD